MASQAPVGIIDSGLGGLSVLREIRRILPSESLIYIGDSSWCPYGSRPADEIQQRVFQLTDLLLVRGVKLIVVACNSATIAAVEALRSSYPIPFAGMEPAIKPAVAASRSGVVGVLATEASFAGQKFHRLLDTHASGVRVITQPCPRLVDLVERGETTGAQARAVVDDYVRPLIDEGADVLVLGCTHYPFLRPLIEASAGERVRVTDTGEAVARHVRHLLHQDQLLTDLRDEGGVELFTSGEPAQWRSIIPCLAPELGDCRVDKLREQVT